MKRFFPLIVLFLVPAGLGGQRQQSRWVDICTQDPSATSYCRDVGKSAYNAFGAPVLRDVRLGKIVGVASAWQSDRNIQGYPVGGDS